MLGLADGAIKRKQTCNRSSGSACVPRLMPMSQHVYVLPCLLSKDGGEEELASPSPTPFAPSLHFPQCEIFLPIPCKSLSRGQQWMCCSSAPCQLMAHECSYHSAKPELMSPLEWPHMLALAWCCGSHCCAAPLRRALTLLRCSQRRSLSAWKGHTALDLKRSQVNPMAFKNPTSFKTAVTAWHLFPTSLAIEQMASFYLIFSIFSCKPLSPVHPGSREAYYHFSS